MGRDPQGELAISKKQDSLRASAAFSNSCFSETSLPMKGRGSEGGCSGSLGPQAQTYLLLCVSSRPPGISMPPDWAALLLLLMLQSGE